MKNKFVIENDGVNVYITLFVKSHRLGKLLTCLFVLFLIGLYVYALSTVPKKEISTYIFPSLLAGIFLFAFPVRYLFWNLFGQEDIIVNTKSISYCRDYGIYRTNLKTLRHDTLATGFEWVRTFDEVKYGNLVFEKINAENNLPEHLYTTSIALKYEDLVTIDTEISKIYKLEVEDEFGFFPISLN